VTVGWRYLVERLNGDGTAELLHPDLPIEGVEITKTLSGPDRITGSLPLSTKGLFDKDGKALLREWSTAIYAMPDDGGDRIYAAGILVAPGQTGGTDFEIDCMGFSGYPQGQPFTDSWFGVQVDPLDVVRRIWAHLQGEPRGNIGIEVDATTSPIRIGEELEVVNFTTSAGEDVSFEAGPVKLNWWTDTDLGKRIDDLARDTPFDYWEEHQVDGDVIRHRLGLAYPRRGRRRDDLRFFVGENVALEPDVVSSEEFANVLLGLGAGEGRDMLKTLMPLDDDRLRRVVVVSDKSARSQKAIDDFTRSQALGRLLGGSVEEISVWDHKNARLGSWVEGDEINVRGDSQWMDLDIWCRVVATTVTPEEPEVAILTLMRTDTLSA
jgi:hypothetical protein